MYLVGPRLLQASEFTVKISVPILHHETVTTVNTHLAFK